MLQTRYDDFEERLASLDRERVRAHVRAAGFVPERACYELLRCYRRSELPRAAAHVLAPDMAYISGFGLYLLDWLEHLHRSFVEWIEAKGKSELPLSTILQECRFHWPELAGSDDAAIETLIGLWPEVQVRRSSIFEATLVVETLRGEEVEGGATSPSAETVAPTPGVKKVTRERRATSKKRAPHETSQQNLWE